MIDSMFVVSIMKMIVLAFLIVNVYNLSSKLLSKHDEFAVLAKDTIDIAIGRAEAGYLSADRITADLSRYGVMYMMKDYNMEPSAFVTMKMITAAGVGFICFLLSPSPLLMLVFFAVGCLIGFFVPDILMRMSNNSDNESMQSDIMSIYVILKIHARAGVYITDSLIECQRSISHPRLKQAINEMNNNILSSRVTLEEAVDQFNARFCNEQIDNISVIIKQALRTGRSADLLADLSKQIDSNNKLRAQKKRDSLKHQTAITQVSFFCGIGVVLVYLIGLQLISSVGTL